MLKSSTKLIGFCLLIPIIISIFLSACSPKNKTADLDFSKTIKISPKNKDRTPNINISVGSMITPKEGYVYYKELLDYIAKKLNRKVNFVEKKSYQEINSLLENGKIDVAFVCGGPYVEGHKKFGLQLLAAPLVNGKTIYHSYIIVKRDSKIKRFKELKGKSFAFADPLSNTGRLAPIYLLAKMGTSPDKFFKESLYTYGHDKSVRAVALGIVDGAAVDSLIWEYLAAKGSKYALNTKVIKVLGPFGIPPVVVRPNLEKKLSDKIKNILLNLHKDKIGKVILDGMAIEKLVEIDDSAYDSIRKMKKALSL